MIHRFDDNAVDMKGTAGRGGTKTRAGANGRMRAGAKLRPAGLAASSVDSRGSMVRIIEDGVDLTPLPLVLPSWKASEGRADSDGLLRSKTPLTASAQTLPTNEELGALEVSYSGDHYDSGTDDETTQPDEGEMEMVQSLVESPTVTLLHIAGICVANDFVGKAKIEERNSAYDAMLAGRASSDRYAVRHCQTINLAMKNQEAWAQPPRSCEAGSQATSWDIYDANLSQAAATDSEDNEDPKAKKPGQPHWQREMHRTLSVAMASADFLLDVSEASVANAESTMSSAACREKPPPIDEADLLFGQRAARILASRDLADSLALVERCVQQNIFHAKQLVYHDRIPAEAVGGDKTSAVAEPPEEAGLEVLWAWSAPMTEGRCVTAMSWNRVNDDVLAVGYGGSSSGLVLFWSLRNPLYPERVLHLASGCTAIDFSLTSPQLLAVGTRDGGVSIYDVRRDRNGVLVAPVLDSEDAAGKHMDPVWQVQWVDKGIERGESLVSISTDGRVVEWSIKKGLEESTLMVLKRVGNSEGVISRQASGLCFDFPIDDASVYLAGTEDGTVHRCSCSYNEQYLETYSGHTGPVYCIRCSPFWPPAFLSCSADWTVKVWHQKHPTYIHSFHSVDLSHVVHDVAWSPRTSTVFASVAGDGRIEIWDLWLSTLDPIVRSFPTDRPKHMGTTTSP